MVIGQHGSWNRSTLAGYRVIFVPFVDGKPSGEPKILLSGFLSPDEKDAYGRPVGVIIGPTARAFWSPTTSATRSGGSRELERPLITPAQKIDTVQESDRVRYPGIDQRLVRKMHQLSIRAVAYEEGGHWLVQGIEYDICARAESADLVPVAFARAVAETICIGHHLGRDPLKNIDPAPNGSGSSSISLPRSSNPFLEPAFPTQSSCRPCTSGSRHTPP